MIRRAWGGGAWFHGLLAQATIVRLTGEERCAGRQPGKWRRRETRGLTGRKNGHGVSNRITYR